MLCRIGTDPRPHVVVMMGMRGIMKIGTNEIGGDDTTWIPTWTDGAQAEVMAVDEASTISQEVATCRTQLWPLTPGTQSLTGKESKNASMP